MKNSFVRGVTHNNTLTLFDIKNETPLTIEPKATIFYILNIRMQMAEIHITCFRNIIGVTKVTEHHSPVTSEVLEP
jgi:hypothetical protein